MADNNNTRFEVVCCMMSWDSSVYNHLMPVARHPLVSRLWIVRPKKSTYGEIPKAEYVLTPSRLKIFRWVKTAVSCFRLGRRKDVKAFVSFNPIPYGLIAYIAAKLNKKPVHLGFIGADWFKHSRNIIGKSFLPAYRRADFITATGDDMKKEMAAEGIDNNKIALLPHPIDISRFPITDPDKAKYACVFVGELIQRKRVDVILDAFAKVTAQYPDARLCIVGDGPLADDLKQQAAGLEISDKVDFVGYATNVQPYVSDAKIVVIASDGEGFPFSLVEGICSGLVPVSTPVGTITDYIHDGENGFLFPQSDPSALADKIIQLLEDPVLYERIRTKALELRDYFSYETATALWDKWFQSIKKIL